MNPYSGAQGRIDYSGVRGGLNRPLTKRAGDFPYDKEPEYGTAKMDKSLAQAKDAGDHPLVPKDISNTHWEEQGDDIEEASGTPINFAKSNSSNMVTTVPGAAKGWASWSDDREVPDEELQAASDAYQNMLPQKARQFVAGVQKRTMSGREGRDMSAWGKIREAFVSLRDTPEGQMTLSQGIDEAELECVMQEYEEQSAKAEGYLDSVDEAEGLKFLFQLDPDHAADSLRDIGKDKIRDTYKTWADRSPMAMPDDQEIE